MYEKKRPLIGIITARASETEQRQILSGILAQAARSGADTAVISNVYDFSEYFADVEVENKIYELIQSDRFDGLILTGESIIDSKLKQFICDNFKDTKIPLIITGADIPGYTCIDTDVRKDFIEIARHLTEVHGFRRIDVLTGHQNYETSLLRVDGVRRVMEEKGLPFTEEDNVIYGNYWMPSGAELADDYVEGRRRIPQALICANDYMAFGFIDRLFELGINPPKDITVVGYEYIGDRIYHSPILTTYRRNRAGLGARAVSMLMSMINGSEPEQVDDSGCMICGNTCTCGIDKKYLQEELNYIRNVKFHRDMNYTGNFEQQAASCRSIADYIRTLQEFAYLIHDVKGIYLCLYENWCNIRNKADLSVSSNNEPMICYRIISPEPANSDPRFFTRKELFPPELPGAGKDRFFYFVPIFSQGRELGHFIFQYTAPTGYDSTMIDWIKNAANALMILSMKNDINALLECNNLSVFHDTATGLYNKRGFDSELDRALKCLRPSETLLIVLVRSGVFTDDTSIDAQSLSVRLDVELAECIKKLSVDKNAFCAKIADKTFALVTYGDLPGNYNDIIEDRLRILISHAPLYSQECGLDTLVTASRFFSMNDSANVGMAFLTEEINHKIQQLSDARCHTNYGDYLRVRNSMYKAPEEEWNAQKTCRAFRLSYGHFRATYKELFGISFHQDLIKSRIALAKYLLLTTAMSLPAIAYKCGYDDDKYFMRQFRQLTGVTPNVYRNYN